MTRSTPNPARNAGRGRLIVVSNRVALPDQLQAGGLASAMHSALAEHGGVWFGWSGKLRKKGESGSLHHAEQHGIRYVTMDITRADYDAYYNCLSNRALWPLLHYRPDLLQFRRSDYAGYLRVNTQFADYLAPLIEAGDLLWIHDYHLLPLAQMLRARGVRNRIGFFLHTPLAAASVLIALPPHRELFGALAACDLVGVQTQADLRALRDYFSNECGASLLADGIIKAVDGRGFRAQAFPIGIDTEAVIASARKAATRPPIVRLRRSLEEHALAIGVDRLDYSKGLPERFEAFGRVLARAEALHHKVNLLQIAPLSRSEVPEYQAIRRELERLAGHINGAYGDPNWAPIHLICQTIKPSLLHGYLRLARVALVTPLRDGMNLVAKEYVAAQDPEDPGVLVLSRFAGAAEQMPEALLVNPNDIDEIADALELALAMPRSERLKRWRALLDSLQHEDIGAWRNRFLDALRGAGTPNQRGKSTAVRSVAAK